MKKTLAGALAAVVLVCGAAGAALADGYPNYPVAANVYVPPEPDWSGFYLHGSLGYGWSDSEQTLTAGGNSWTADINADGFIGAIGLGYDRQIHRDIVLGVFADYTIGELDDDFTLVGVPATAEYDNIFAIGGRLGVTVHQDLMLFGSVGYTSADIKLSNAGGSESFDLDGYFLGVGLERKIRDNLYLTADYRYSDYGDHGYTVTAGGCGGTCDFDFEDELHHVRFGLNYKFNRAPEAMPVPMK